MVLSLISPFLILAVVITGIRHGFDWDHIAAISDITSTQSKVGKGVFMSFLYGLGHASVVAAIALGFLFASLELPKSVNKTMETIVGITLIILGIYVFYSLHRQKGEDFRMLPRWALAVNAILNSYSWLKAKLTGTHRKHHQILKNGYGNRASFMIGTIHGLGAETPTQMVLFALAITAGASGTRGVGALAIVAYSIGLVTTNTLMGVLGAYGYIKSSKQHRLYRSLAFVTGSFSMVIGILFLFGGVSYLPDLEAMIGG